MVDDLERACAQVGRFLYHFAKLENQIDVAFAKLFELDTSYAEIITGSVDFLKRYNMCAYRYAPADEGKGTWSSARDPEQGASSQQCASCGGSLTLRARGRRREVYAGRRKGRRREGAR